MKIVLKILGVVFVVIGAIILLAGRSAATDALGVIILLVMGGPPIALGVFFLMRSRKKPDQAGANVPDQPTVPPMPEPQPETMPEPEPEPIIEEPAAPDPEPDPAPEEPNYQYYGFKVAGISFREKDVIKNLMDESYEYSMTKRELIDLCMTDQRIYKYLGAPHDVELVPEPDNIHDKNAIKVVADGVHIGYVPREKTAEVKELLATKEIVLIACELYGGPYKILTEDYDDDGKEIYTMNRDRLSIGAQIAIKYK